MSAAPANYDAAWVFAKYRTTGGTWQHVNLNYVNGTADGHTAPSGVSIHTVQAGIGCHIFRSGVGSGNVNWQNIELKWNYPVSIGDQDYIEIRVFAIEMVYVPQGSFYLGAGTGTENNHFYSYPTASSNFQVTSENAINVGTISGYLYMLIHQAMEDMGRGLSLLPLIKVFHPFIV